MFFFSFLLLGSVFYEYYLFKGSLSSRFQFGFVAIMLDNEYDIYIFYIFHFVM